MVGKVRQRAHVEAVGYGLTSLNVRVASPKPKGGILSAPVKKLRTSPIVISVWPPTRNKTECQGCYTNLSIVGYFRELKFQEQLRSSYNSVIPSTSSKKFRKKTYVDCSFIKESEPCSENILFFSISRTQSTISENKQ